MKILGIIFIMCGACASAYVLCAKAQNRIVELNIIKNFLIMLKGEIRYSLSPLPDGFNTISDKLIRDEEAFLSIFLKKLSNELQEMKCTSFMQAWTGNVNLYIKGKTSLNNKDIDEFIQLGSNLGYLDSQMQLNTIDMYLEKISQNLDSSNKELKDKCRVYKCVTIALGLFTSIIVI